MSAEARRSGSRAPHPEAGCVFLYPADHRAGGRARLRILYDASPRAFLIEQEDRAASDGSGRILDVLLPETLHQRTGVILGDVDEVATASMPGR